MIRVTVEIRGLTDQLRQAEQSAFDELEALIFNLVPYVIFLEHGTSQAQAPQGMVRVSMEEIKAHLVKAMGDARLSVALMEGRFRGAVAFALDDTAEFGRLLIRSRTPIETGRARQGWEVSLADDNNAEAIVAAAEKQVLWARAQPRLRGLVRARRAARGG